MTLAAAAVVLFGPLWDSAVGENPLERESGIDLWVVVGLGLPTVVVLGTLCVALALGRWPTGPGSTRSDRAALR